MPLSPLARWAGPLSVTAAVLVVLSQVLRLGIGMMLGDGSGSTPTHTLTYGMALVGMFVLLLALTAVYVREHDTLGRVGLAGYLTAFLGTLLVAGDWWFEAFVVPNLAVEAPAILDLAPSGSMLIGAISTVGLYSVGWILFGLANLRVAEVPRPAAILMVLGGLAGPLALTTPYQVPLAIAVGWIGLALGRPPADPRSTDTPSDNSPQGEARSSDASG